ncbi:hypothetical protein TVAG_152520 [Trichomonas vaginalis G3]|uniref:Surface antigen BspA-like n=1 Tax=Trichomonas vaginalis (strain ATCC PRA-98 / G3) TaxID=412133 RepID=A2FPK0_TRIV3|nr:hypothetical protein TVAGG3_0710550 [Trichomonas vaginalis G3]EAX93164.1 hypothetical protein TVAG_152520 [Trichomonas vaginalis G3]KAI5509872.1 hypothetical protein TVAGG3_0710550 [Trichomonas vaginalis G3]|eukprot:XP_001306094.1 hypothetical protein [Trichomonas vaginalis G3]
MNKALFLKHLANPDFCFAKSNFKACSPSSKILTPDNYSQWAGFVNPYLDTVTIYYADDTIDSNNKQLYLNLTGLPDISELILSSENSYKHVSLESSQLTQASLKITLNSVSLYSDQAIIKGNKLQLISCKAEDKYRFSLKYLYIDDASLLNFDASIDCSTTYLELTNKNSVVKANFVHAGTSYVKFTGIQDDGTVKFENNLIEIETSKLQSQFKFDNSQTNVEFIFADSVKKFSVYNMYESENSLFAHTTFNGRSDLVLDTPINIGSSLPGPIVNTEKGYNLYLGTHMAGYRLQTGFANTDAKGIINADANKSFIIPTVPILPETTITGKSLYTGEIVTSPLSCKLTADVEQFYADLMTNNGDEVSLEGKAIYRIKHIMGNNANIKIDKLGNLDTCGNVRTKLSFNSLENGRIKYHFHTENIKEGTFNVISGSGIDCENSKFIYDELPYKDFDAKITCSKDTGVTVTVTKLDSYKFCLTNLSNKCPSGYQMISNTENLDQLMTSNYAKIFVFTDNQQYHFPIKISRNDKVKIEFITENKDVYADIADESLSTPLVIKSTGVNLNYQGNSKSCNILSMDVSSATVIGLYNLDVADQQQSWTVDFDNSYPYSKKDKRTLKIRSDLYTFNVKADLQSDYLIFPNNDVKIESEKIITVESSRTVNYKGPDIVLAGNIYSADLTLTNSQINPISQTPKILSLKFNGLIQSLTVSENSKLILEGTSSSASIKQLTMSPSSSFEIKNNFEIEELVISSNSNISLPSNLVCKRLTMREGSVALVNNNLHLSELSQDVVPSLLSLVIVKSDSLQIDSISIAMMVDKDDVAPHKYYELPDLMIISGKNSIGKYKVNAVNPYYNTPEGVLSVVSSSSGAFLGHRDQPTYSPTTQVPPTYSPTVVPPTSSPTSDESNSRKKDLVFSAIFSLSGVVVLVVVVLLLYFIAIRPCKAKIDNNPLLSVQNMI